jgi:hypothetical protein
VNDRSARVLVKETAELSGRLSIEGVAALVSTKEKDEIEGVAARVSAKEKDEVAG